MRIVEIVPYRPEWPQIYQHEARRLELEMIPFIGSVYHIGSTSIPWMSAKPVIDILIEYRRIDDVPEIETRLKKLGYASLRKNIIPNVSFFTFREKNDIRYHLHIYPVGDPQVKRHVNFRDYLTRYRDEAAAYQELKLLLAQRYRNDISQYVASKSELVQQIDRKAKQWNEQRSDVILSSKTPVATEWTTDRITLAMEANLNVHMTHFAQYLNQARLVRIPDYTIVDSGLPDDTFNYVLRADFNDRDAEKKISEVTAYFKSREIPFSWWNSPSDQPDNLVKHLECAGYRNTENYKAVYFNLDDLNTDSVDMHQELKIIRALDQQSLRDFAVVLANDPFSFEKYFAWLADVISEDDPIEYYVGYVNNVPVVRGLVCYYANVAGLYWLSTVPVMRNRGYATAMQQYRLKLAKDRGYQIAVLQASEQGFPLYQRLGYKECGVFREFKITNNS